MDFSDAIESLHKVDDTNYNKLVSDLIVLSDADQTWVEPRTGSFLRHNLRSNRETVLNGLRQHFNHDGKREAFVKLVQTYITRRNKRHRSPSDELDDAFAGSSSEKKWKGDCPWKPNALLWQDTERHLRGSRRGEVQKLCAAVQCSTVDVLIEKFQSDAQTVDAAWHTVNNKSSFAHLRHVLFSCQGMTLEQRVAGCLVEFAPDPCVAIIHDDGSRNRVFQELRDGLHIVIRSDYKLTGRDREVLKGLSCIVETDVQPHVEQADATVSVADLVHNAIEKLDASNDVKAMIRKAIPPHSTPAGVDSKRVVFESLEVCGLGPFKHSVNYKMDVAGVHWVTAAQNNTRNNGLGKSTLCVSAILWCLTGLMEDKGINSGRVKQSDFVHHESNEAYVTLRGTLYEGDDGNSDEGFVVFRRVTRESSNSFRFEIGGSSLSGRKGETELFRRLFGVTASAESRITRSRSNPPSLVAPSAEDFSSTAKDRRTFLLHTLLYSRHGHLAVSADAENRRRAVQQLDDVAFLVAVVNVAEEQQRHIREQLDLISKNKQKLMDEVHTTRGAIQEIDKQLQFVQVDVNKLEKGFDDVAAEESRLDREDEELQENERQLNQRAKEQLLHVQRVEAQLQELRFKSSNTLKRLRQLRTLQPMQNCPTCTQTLNIALVEQLIEDIKVEEKAFSDQTSQAEVELQRAEASRGATLQQVQDVDSKRRDISTKIRRIRARKDHLAKELSGARAIQGKGEELKRRRMEHKNMMTALEGKIGALDEQVQAKQLKCDEWDEVIEVFHPQSGSLKVDIHKESWNQINTATNSWLSLFFPSGAPPFSLHASDADMSELKWRSDSPSGRLSQLSTSQLLRAQLAFFLGFSDVLLRRKGVYCNLRVLDELFYGLDAMSVARVLDGVSQMCEKNPRMSVFIPSVAPIKPIGFDWEQIIVLTKDGTVEQY